MQYLLMIVFSLILSLSNSSSADAQSVDEIIFSDNYIGWLELDDELKKYLIPVEDEYLRRYAVDLSLDAYILPIRQKESLGKTTVKPVCVEGDGTGCFQWGVLYKQKVKGVGRDRDWFYLVKDAEGREVWVAFGNAHETLFDDMVGRGDVKFITAADFKETDTSLEDKVPRLDDGLALQKILSVVSPQYGTLTLHIPAGKKDVLVWQSNESRNQAPLKLAIEQLRLGADPVYNPKRNEYDVELLTFKKDKNFRVVAVDFFEGTKVHHSVYGDHYSYIWLDTKGLRPSFDPSPTLNPLDPGHESFKVVEVGVFNGHKYALMETYRNISDPYLSTKENYDRLGYNSYLISRSWVNIRDKNNKLRFWFGGPVGH